MNVEVDWSTPESAIRSFLRVHGWSAGHAADVVAVSGRDIDRLASSLSDPAPVPACAPEAPPRRQLMRIELDEEGTIHLVAMWGRTYVRSDEFESPTIGVGVYMRDSIDMLIERARRLSGKDPG